MMKITAEIEPNVKTRKLRDVMVIMRFKSLKDKTWHSVFSFIKRKKKCGGAKFEIQ